MAGRRSLIRCPFHPTGAVGSPLALFAGCSSPNSGLMGLDTCFRYLGRLLSSQASHFFEEGRNSEHAWSPSQLSPPRAQGSLRSAAGPQPGTPAAAGYSSIPVLAPAPEPGAVTCGAGAPPPNTSLARVKERISTPGPPRVTFVSFHPKVMMNPGLTRRLFSFRDSGKWDRCPNKPKCARRSS